VSLWIENRQTRQAWILEGVAARDARAAQHKAQVYLSRSLYEQARALGMSRPLGSHWEILDLLREAEQLRRSESLPREQTQPDDPRRQLPSRLSLRSEAVSALLQDDAKLVDRIEMSLAQPALSPGARLVAYFTASGVKMLKLGDTDMSDAGDAPRDYPGIRGTALAVDATGSSLVAFDASSGALQLWDLGPGDVAATLAWPPPNEEIEPAAPALGPLFSSEMSFSPDGRYFTAIRRDAGQDATQTLVVWDLANDRQPRSLVAVPRDTDRGGACFRADGSWLAYLTDERTVTCWDPRSGQPLLEVRLPRSILGRLAVSPAGKVVACPCAGDADDAGVLLLWDFGANEEILRLPVDCDLKAAAVAFSHSGHRLALATRRGRICIFDVAAGRLVVDLPAAHPFATAVLGWGQDGDQLFSWGGVEGFLKRWQVSDPPRVAVRTGLRGGRFALSPDGQQLAVACASGPRVHMLDRATGALQRVLLGFQNTGSSILVFSRDSRQVAAINADGAVVWDVETGRFVARLEQGTGLTGRITSAAFGPDGDLLASVARSQSPRVAVWDVLRGREIWRAPDDVALDSAYLLASGRFLAGIDQAPFISNPKLIAFEIPSGRAVAESELPGKPIDAQSFSPDGQWMATLRFRGGDPMFAMFGATGSTQTRAEVVLARFPDGATGIAVPGLSTPSATAFSPDSRLMAIGYQDGLVKLCRVSDGAELFHVRLATGAIEQLAFSSDATALAATNGDGNVQFVDLPAIRRGLADSGLDW
jgi:WD40 repeat protein